MSLPVVCSGSSVICLSLLYQLLIFQRKEDLRASSLHDGQSGGRSADSDHPEEERGGGGARWVTARQLSTDWLNRLGTLNVFYWQTGCEQVDAPFTLPFGCSFSAPILRLHLGENLSEAARGEIGLRHWPASGGRIRAVLLEHRTSVNVSAGFAHQGRVDRTVNCTGPSLNLIQRNVP